ncbi:MAG: dephospho-CoA kinase [Methylocystaceae bacterium]|nr:dephospho-CoA kinase [Methylocystaceae bacterium]
MYILGLTGSIGMGKSATAQMFRDFAIPVHDADATVHQLMGPKGRATEQIEKAFPGSIQENGAVDRQKLGEYVFENPQELKKLEAILHPLVRAEEQKFLRLQQLHKKSLVVLDIPLLFETHGEKRCDGVAVVSASKSLQYRRVMARTGMTSDKFAAILKKQMPDFEKRKRADFVILSGNGYRVARNKVKRIIQQVSYG